MRKKQIREFKLRLNTPLNLKRRFNPPFLQGGGGDFYQSRILTLKNTRNQTGHCEIINSQKLAEDLSFMQLRSREQNINLKNLLGRKVLHKQIPIAAMLNNLNYNSVQEALDLISQGFKTLKFKITKNYLEESKIINLIHTQISSDIKIRLDANQTLNLKQALELASKIKNINLEYFEEPLQNPLELSEFSKITQINIALDECLINYSNTPDKILDLTGVTHFALKPFLLPNYHKILELINLGEENNKKVIICSAFESGLSLSWLALLASTINSLSAAGLSTYRWFSEDLIKPQFSSQNGFISTNQALENIDKFTNM